MLCVGIAFGDFAVKAWAQLSLVEPVTVASWFHLRVIHNRGLFLGLVPVFEMGLVHWMLLLPVALGAVFRMATARCAAVAAGLAVALGGLTGNLIDRGRGAVVDYLAFGPFVQDKWLYMNIADLAMLTGLMLLSTVLIRRQVQRRHGRRRPV
ncbi:MAG: signal peptidase II [Defluviicoccus sp.]|nr:signal peptidase II [Defluviicoccus sp.]MDE0382471.1 signal peptidase II [Defluviicoccus sp.]